MFWEERKERKNRNAKLNIGRWRRFICIREKHGRRKKKERKKENSTELQKPIEVEVYNNNRKFDWIYTHNQNQNSPTKIKYNRFWPSKQRKPKILSTRTKLIKAQTVEQN